MKRWFTRTLSVLLVGALLLQLPVRGVWAEEPLVETSAATVVTTDPLTLADEGVEDAYIVEELTDLREESVKYFRRSDSSVVAAAYGQPVHYQEDGVYRDIDNTLRSVTENGKAYWKNTAGAVEMLLPKQWGTAPVTLRYQGHTITLSPTQAQSVSALLTQPPEDPTAENAALKTQLLQLTADQKETAKDICDTINQNSVNARTLHAAVTYAGNKLMPAIEYELNGSSLKESIVLHSFPASAVYSFTVNSGTLTPVLQADRSVTFVDETGKTIFVIPSPYMWDAAGVQSDAVAVTLTPTANGTYTYTLTPDRTWLADAKRVYPVTVDPTVTVSGENTVKDTTAVATAKPAWMVDGEKVYLSVGNRGMETDSLIHIPFPTQITAEANKMVRATIELDLYSNQNQSTTPLQINAHRITSDWGVSNLEDNEFVYGSAFPSYNTQIEDYILVNKTDTQYTGYSLDITRLANDWLENGNAYGVLLRSPNAGANEFVSFCSSEIVNSEPVAYYEYCSISGLEGYWSYSAVGAGRDGTLAVNHANGNVTVSQPVTLDAGGTRLPVSLALVYNSNRITTSQPHTLCGSGWQTNYHVYIRPTDDTVHYRYYLYDGDGTRHDFYFENATATEGVDEDGMDLTLTVNTAVSNTSRTDVRYTVTDSDDTVMEFNGYGYLLRIRDKNGNTATLAYESITYNGTNYERLSTITDGAGRVYTLRYTAPGYPRHLYGVKDPYGRITSWTLQSKVTSVTFPDGKKVTYTYESGSSRLASVANTDGTTTTVTWNGTRADTVALVNTLVDNYVISQYEFDYTPYQTTVTDTAHTVPVGMVYQLDSRGRVTGTLIQNSGMAIFASYVDTDGQPASPQTNKVESQSKVQRGIYNLLKNHGFQSNINSYSRTDYTGQTVTYAYDGTKGHSALGSLKLSRTAATESAKTYAFLYQPVTIPADGDYTFSAYVSSNGLTGTAVQVRLECYDTNGTQVAVKYARMSEATASWQRMSATLEAEAGQTLRCVIGFTDRTTMGTLWFDDLQLEYGQTANPYNVLENSALLTDTTSWSGTATRVALTDGELPNLGYAVTLTGAPLADHTRYSQTVRTHGQQGDIFNLSGWMKAVSSCNPAHEFSLLIEFYDQNGTVFTPQNENAYRVVYNPYISNWQFRSGEIIAPCDYSKVVVHYNYDGNVNTLTAAGLCLLKENYGQTYGYDDDGNVVSSVALSQTQTGFAYTDDRLSKLFSPTGSSYSYGYDDKGNLANAMSSDGQVVTFTYDSAGNPLTSTAWEMTPVTQIVSGGKYIFVNAETRNMLDCGGSVTNSRIHNWNYSKDDLNQEWTITAATDGYTLSVVPTEGGTRFYMTMVEEDTGGKGNPLYIRAGGNAVGQQFRLQKNSDDTFTIFATYGEFNVWCVDAQPGIEDGGSANGVGIAMFPYTEGDLGQKWYVYEAEMTAETTQHIASSVTYTADMNFIAAQTDARGKTVSYTYNSLGQLETVTDPKGVQTAYTYVTNTNNLRSITSEGRTVTYDYDTYDRLAAINIGSGGKYAFTYGKTGQQEQVSVSMTGENGTYSQPLSQTVYNSLLLPASVTYGNGMSQHWRYDALGRLIRQSYDGATFITRYKYREDGALGTIIDDTNGRTQTYDYDLAGRMVRSVLQKTTNTAPILSFAAVYEDRVDRLSSYTVDTAASDSVTFGFIYGDLALSQMPDAVYGITKNGTREVSYTYDRLGRLLSRTLNVPNLTTSYTYGTTDTATTSLVKTVTQNGVTTSYYYDNVGNITRIVPTSGDRHIYQYDGLNQLTRSSIGGVVVDYTYDEYGNLLTKKNISTDETDTYTYGSWYWTDLLTAYNGQTIIYDTIGNPLTYRDGMTMTWQQGRKLATVTKDNVTTTYVYDHNGDRLSKTVGTDVTNYYVMDGTLYALQLPNGTVMEFSYDADGRVYGFTYGGTNYYYLQNLQGDVTAIVDSSSTTVVSYTYDAWGNPLSVTGTLAGTVGMHNPFRYRGYIYDTETGFYYLQSRYYDPETGRFVNADDVDVLNVETESLLHYNLFAYCWNNPVNMADDDGYLPWFVAAAVGGALFDTAAYLIGSAISGQKITWAGVGKAALTGAITGVAFGALGKGLKAISSAVKTSKAIKYTTGTVNQIGRIGEKISGIVKNKVKYFINGRWRIPDGITKRFVQEVKNVKSLSLTSQLKDSIQLAQNMGKKVQLFIRPDTYLTAPLKRAIKQYGIKVTYLW